MIAACVERTSAAGCGGCEREEACAQLFRRFGLNLARMGSGGPTRRRATADSAGVLGAILGELARNFEARMARKAPARPPGHPFREEMERRLEPLLAGGHVRMETVARSMGLSRQTLYRRLREEGLTFEVLLDGLRRKLALRFLKEDRLSVKDAAYRLGFADPAAFSRAFKRWTGMSPSAARGRR